MDETYMDKYQVTRALPPLKPLRAFVLVALTKSFTTTGKHMHLSQSAVSSQIKQLEEHLGIQLFERKPNGLTLTEVGKRYAAPVTQALDILIDATVEAIEYHEYTDFKLQIPAIFAAWLNPRLDEFKKLHPHIKVHFQKLKDTLFLGDSVDMAIMHHHWISPQNGTDPVAKDHFNLVLPTENGHEPSDWCLIFLQERSSEYAIKTFREWLLQEVHLFSSLPQAAPA